MENQFCCTSSGDLFRDCEIRIGKDKKRKKNTWLDFNPWLLDYKAFAGLLVCYNFFLNRMYWTRYDSYFLEELRRDQQAERKVGSSHWSKGFELRSPNHACAEQTRACLCDLTPLKSLLVWKLKLFTAHDPFKFFLTMQIENKKLFTCLSIQKPIGGTLAMKRWI